MTASARTAFSTDEGVRPTSSAQLALGFGATPAEAQGLLFGLWRTWTDECYAFLNDLARDEAEVAQKLMACKSPLDLLIVQQTWMLGRMKALINAGSRAFTAAFVQPEETAAELANFRLPE